MVNGRCFQRCCWTTIDLTKIKIYIKAASGDNGFTLEKKQWTKKEDKRAIT